MTEYHIPYYLDFLSPELLGRLDADSEPVSAVPGLKVASGLRDEFADILGDEALRFVVALYERVRGQLRTVLDARAVARSFIDRETAAAVVRNRATGRAWTDDDYETVIGRRDEFGEVVVGPATDAPSPRRVAVPSALAGDQVTLFGPPDTAKMSINAMNTLHRRLPDEPPVVGELLARSGMVPRWGADNEDSKTPITRNLLAACRNLIGCFDGTLAFTDEARGKTYRLADAGRSIPIKRIPGLALPDGSFLLDGSPIPFHIWDFALHLFHNHARPEALVFYIPKLETEAEAAYLAALIEAGEAMVRERSPDYAPGTVRLFIVFENPRAIFRIREIADALHPWFLGGSLGWHDFLGSTARLFRNDPNYRIPVKADPNIVINHIKESHVILSRAMAEIGGIGIGGMYGVLYEEGNQASFDVSMVGFIRDVVTQLKRGLDGFWIAHPNFVRLGIALVAAWRERDADPASTALDTLVAGLVTDPVALGGLRDFIAGPDVPGLDATDPHYARAVLAADLAESDVIANNDPAEVRYNIFQALQYLADWLTGNGCVALPATLRNHLGEDVFVRVMDDLATTERSRWELWAEVRHGRVSTAEFEAILAEEVEFLRAGVDTPTRRIQVRWEGEAARWYPTAVRLLRSLVRSPNPVEFATQLLMPFTLDFVRAAEDPWAEVVAHCPGRYDAAQP